MNTHWFQTNLDRSGLNKKQLAKRIGIGASAVSQLLNGSRALKASEASAISLVFNTHVNEVLKAFGAEVEGAKPERLRIHGFVGADNEIILRDIHPDGSLDEIDAPFPGYQGIAVRIRGTSMAPRYRDREVIAYTPGGAEIGQLIGLEVVAKLEDGRLVLKMLRKGNEPDRYTLVSLDPEIEPITNVAIQWASPIDFHIPSRR